ERGDFSARLWPVAEQAPVFVPDATALLDPAHAADRRLLDAGARSLCIAPIRVDGRPLGLLVLSSTRAGAFDPSQISTLTPIFDFLALAAERERLWANEQARHARRVKLEALLPTLAESLDVRKVFLSASKVIQEVLPHDVLAFALLAADRGGVRVQAATEQGVMELPEYRFSNEEEALDSNWQYLLAYDLEPVDAVSVRARISPREAPERVEVVTRPGAAWMAFITRARIRSTMRVPIRAKDRPIGGIVFMSRSADAYDGEDGVLASRIADHVALALAHQELAEEERRIALAEERARVLEGRVDALSRELDRFSAHRALGQSASWKKALADATQVAGTDTTVLVTGESGTGKEVIARFIHRGSKRAKGPFVALNCAALPEQLLESELFGHERGAFTGAVEARPGKIEQASGGMLFLDEVGEMSPSVQAKFLRVLQEREFQRVGGSKTIKADVRIVAATNRDPRAAIAKGEFREDLYYRLGVFEIHLPPLRERPEDILVLAEAFLEEVGRTVGRPAAGISEDAREQMLVHSWPGNVRELRNAIERAVILAHGGLVTREHLPITVARPPAERVAIAAPEAAAFPVEGVALQAVEKELLLKAMAKAGDNKSQAAKLLGLSRGQLYSLLRKHGLTDARR
ncbi:MAG TPA: sigma 54-interacting transcriptional regulator, partial [Candidatus Eisenbacteria bacterium]|nr:sigma 54-interacting transcriptional regulator [Candidatus Eisenbacteria bacterium]